MWSFLFIANHLQASGWELARGRDRMGQNGWGGSMSGWNAPWRRRLVGLREAISGRVKAG